jgi:hypothetical protein
MYELRKMATQYVRNVLSQTPATPEDLALAGTRKAARMGDLLLLLQTYKKRYPHAERPSQP